MRRLLAAEAYRQFTTYVHSWRDTVALLARSIIAMAFIAFFCASLTQPNREFLLVSSTLILLITNTVIGANYEISVYARGDRAAQFFSPATNPFDWCLAISLIQLSLSVILAAVCVLIFVPIHPPVDPRTTMIGTSATAIISLQLASLIGLHSARSGSFRTSSLFIGVALLFSGMLYPISTLPVAMQMVARAIPYTYALDLARIGYSGGSYSLDPSASVRTVALTLLLLTLLPALVRLRAHLDTPYDR